MDASDSADFDRQYRALETGRAVVDLAGWSSIAVTGKDRHAFLHNFCTNDVKRLVPGASCEAFFTNVKGKIVGHGIIICRETELSFFGAPGQATRLIEHLDRYIIREDVQLRDTTAERSYMLAAGDEIPAAEFDACISWNLTGRGDEYICEIRSSETSLIRRLVDDHGFIVAEPAAFVTARIEAGTPLFGIDFDEHNLPQEVGRDREAISFTKGCYLGQETVARIDALGHVNQRCVGVRFFGTVVPAAGAELSLDGQVVGRVTSACFSPKLAAPLALAMVRREANASGTRLDSSLGECEVLAQPLG